MVKTGPTSARPLDSGCVLDLRFNEGVGSKVYDVSGSRNHGELIGSFGTSLGTSYTTVAANQMYGSKFTSPADANGLLTSIIWYGRTGSGTGNAKAILVDAALNIVAVSDPVATSATAQELTCTFSSPPTITASTDYILMMIFDVSTRFYYGAGAANQGALDTTNNYAVPTDPTDATNNNNQYRLRAIYLSAGMWTAGKYGKALLFTPNDYVLTPLDTSGYSAITMEAWVNPGNLDWGPTTVNRNIIATQLGVAAKTYLMVNKDTFKASMTVTTVTEIRNKIHDTVLAQGQWYHVVGTYDGANTIMYVNGVASLPVAQTGILAATDVSTYIGWGLSTRWWVGIIDEARVYNRALSAEEIQTRYNSRGRI